MTVSFRHCAIVAKDLSRLVSFYCHLGFEVVSHAEERGDFVSHLVGLDDAVLEVAKLKFGSGAGLLEIIQYQQPLSPQGAWVNPNDAGFSHIAITTRDLSDSAKTLVNLGGVLISEPRYSQDGSVIACYARDPENNIIELVEDVGCA